MCLSDRPFRATREATITKKSMEDFADWLSKYCEILHPDHGIEYWSVLHHKHKATSILGERVEGFTSQNRAWDVAVYPYTGRNEGMRIDIAIASVDHIDVLATAKVFSSSEKVWAMARSIHQAMESILLWNEEPVLVDLAAMVPRMKKYSYSLRVDAKLLGPLRASRSERCLQVYHGEHQLAEHALEGDPRYVQHEIDALLADWATVARCLGVSEPVLDYEPADIAA